MANEVIAAIVSILVFLLYVAGILSAFHMLFKNRSSQGTIAWLFALATFPALSLPLYWIFGQNRLFSYIRFNREGQHKREALSLKVMELLEKYYLQDSDIPAVGIIAEKLTDTSLALGNSAELLIDGEATFESILAGIDSAREYILVQFFIVEDDELGRELQQRLIKKAKEGVSVHFLYDMGPSRNYRRELTEAGVKIFSFHARQKPYNKLHVNFRNHRKTVIVDGVSSWLGGHNVSNDYLGRGKLGYWRDTHVKITGPSTLVAQLSFINDWHWATGEILDVPWNTPTVSKKNTPILITPTGPADSFETASLMIVHTINSAKERIWIASPYFVPDDAVTSALQLAALRGVDVRILIPDKPDHYTVFFASFSYCAKVMRSGVRFYRYTRGFMHQKTMLIDKECMAIGTTNLDNRSFRLNFEMTSFIFDSELARNGEKMFENDFAHSRLMDESDYLNRSFFFKLKVRLADLFSPML